MSDDELHLLEIVIEEKSGRRQYGVNFDSDEVWPSEEAIKEVHRKCQETFEHTRLATGQTLGYLGVTGAGELAEVALADPEEVEQ